MEQPVTFESLKDKYSEIFQQYEIISQEGLVEFTRALQNLPSQDTLTPKQLELVRSSSIKTLMSNNLVNLLGELGFNSKNIALVINIIFDEIPGSLKVLTVNENTVAYVRGER